MYRRTLITAGPVCLAAAAGALRAQQARPAFDAKEYWDKNHRESRSLARPEPNAFLMSMVKGRKPGKALDVGMGPGRNAIWLARQGWDVSGFDISGVAVDAALEAAKAAGVKINAFVKDLKEWDYGTAQWDLVLLCYMQGDARFRSKQVIDSLRPGGVVIIETWHQDLDKETGRKVGGFETNEVFKLYGSLRIRHYEDTVAEPDWGKELGGKPRPVVRIMAEKMTS